MFKWQSWAQPVRYSLILNPSWLKMSNLRRKKLVGIQHYRTLLRRTSRRAANRARKPRWAQQFRTLIRTRADSVSRPKVQVFRTYPTLRTQRLHLRPKRAGIKPANFQNTLYKCSRDFLSKNVAKINHQASYLHHLSRYVIYVMGRHLESHVLKQLKKSEQNCLN